MFNAEFYPCPKEVIERMTDDLDLFGKTILEPSAGKGDIVEYCKKQGANVIVCELNNDLALIAANKADRFLKADFFEVKAEEISHIDFIIMNPPFSNADKHILHALEIAPEGCTIVALCNYQTILMKHTTDRRILAEKIEKFGSAVNIGSVFSTAERETDIDVGLIKLHKPKTGSSEFDDYFLFDHNEEEEANGSNGIMRHDEIREIVNRYVGAVKMYDEVMAANAKINTLIRPISGFDISFGAYRTRGNNYYDITRENFKTELQKSSWGVVFEKMKMNKYLTANVKEEINKFVEQQKSVPFTMKNIYKMIDIIVGTHSGRMEKVMLEAFDYICSLSADNSEAGEHWKTNSSYKINKRFIHPYLCEYDARWGGIAHVKIAIGRNYYRIMDIIKVLCLITGEKYEDVTQIEITDDYGNKRMVENNLYTFFASNKVPWGEWVQWNKFFKVRGYKKKTAHFEFVDENVYWLFNQKIASIKGWQIPQKTDKKKKK